MQQDLGDAVSTEKTGHINHEMFIMFSSGPICLVGGWETAELLNWSFGGRGIICSAFLSVKVIAHHWLRPIIILEYQWKS